LKLVEQSNFAFYVFFEQKKFIDSYILDEMTKILTEIRPNQVISDSSILKKLKCLQNILYVLTLKISKQKNSFIFTTQILDNPKLVNVWRNIRLLEFNANRTLF